MNAISAPKPLVASASPEKSRLQWVDTAKGLAIIMVVMVHTINTNTIIQDFMQTYVMPWFFMMAGIFLVGKIEKESFSAHFKKRFCRIMIPYFVFWLLVYVPFNWSYFHFIIPDAQVSLWQRGLAHIVGLNEDWGYEWRGELWFLPTLFLADLIVWSIWKYCYKVRFLILALIVGAGILYNHYVSMSLLWRFQTALIASLFVFAGIYTKEQKSTLTALIFTAGAFVVLWILNDFKGIAMVNDFYAVPYIALPMCVFISFFLTLLCKRLPATRFLTQLGQASLMIYVIHMVLLPFVSYAFIHFHIRDNMFVELAVAIPLDVFIAWGSMKVGRWIDSKFPIIFGDLSGLKKKKALKLASQM